MAMSEAQKNKFIVNRVHLIKNINLTEEFYSYLQAGKHISSEMKDEIKVCTESFLMNMKKCYCCTTLI